MKRFVEMISKSEEISEAVDYQPGKLSFNEVIKNISGE